MAILLKMFRIMKILTMLPVIVTISFMLINILLCYDYAGIFVFHMHDAILCSCGFHRIVLEDCMTEGRKSQKQQNFLLNYFPIKLQSTCRRLMRKYSYGFSYPFLDIIFNWFFYNGRMRAFLYHGSTS